MAISDPVAVLVQALRNGESFSVPQVGTFHHNDGQLRLQPGWENLTSLHTYLQGSQHIPEGEVDAAARQLGAAVRRQVESSGRLSLAEVGDLVWDGAAVQLVAVGAEAPKRELSAEEVAAAAQKISDTTVRAEDGRAVIAPRPKFKTEQSPSEKRAATAAAIAKMTAPKASAATPSTPAPATGAGIAAQTTKSPAVLPDITPEEILHPHQIEVQDLEPQEPKKINWMIVSMYVLVTQLLVLIVLIWVFRGDIRDRIQNNPGSAATASTSPRTTPAPATASTAVAPAAENQQPDAGNTEAKPEATPAAATPAPTAQPTPAETKPAPVVAAKPEPKPAAPKPAATGAGTTGDWRLVIASFPTRSEGLDQLGYWVSRPGWNPELEEWSDGRWRLSIWRGKTNAAIKAKLPDAQAAGAPADAYGKKWN